MKTLSLMIGFLSYSFLSYSQSNNWWKMDGTNTATNTSAVGTSNNQALRFKSYGTEWMSISPTGKYTFNSLTDLSLNGLAGLRSNGELYRINLTGNSTDVFLGNGTFSSLSFVTGWNFNNLNLTTGYNVGIGTSITPERLTVNGNILATGSVSATSLNVVDMELSGREFKIATSLCIKGQSILDSTSRNEICGMEGPLYIQSETSNDNDVVFNFGNNSKTGFGVMPTEDFHVGVDARFDGRVTINRITVSDSIFALGDNSIYFNTYYNNMWGGTNTSIKGTGIGQNTFGVGLNSIAIGKRVRADGDFAMVIGKTDSNIPIFNNTTDNSLMIAFNSNIPTLFVGPSNGLNTFGKIGIGTSTPGDRFQIGNDYTSLTIGGADDADLHFGTSYIGFNATRTNTGWNIKTDGSHNGGNAIISTINGGMYFVGINYIDSVGGTVDQTNLTDQQVITQSKMIIHPNGEVTIGTNCPASGYNLGVKGGIITDEVNILITQSDNCWPDEVFSDEYELKPLSEVEKFVETNSHLEGVPSASEVENNGIDLKQMVMILLKKQEETTLYMIDLDKRLDEKQKKIDSLEAELKALKKN